VPVTLFDAFAMSAPRGKPLLVLLDARRGEVYAQLYDAKGNADGPPAVLSVEAARQVALQSAATLTGSGAPLLFDAGAAKARIVDDAPTSDIETIARLAARAGEQAGPPVPLYLRSADAKPQSGFAVERRGDRS
jgi:tRNA threonylcarbamoyladenosine biosynthesis protein TsaB